jgi:hypothetical protein
MPKPMAGKMVLRRPIWSASLPKNSSAATLPST